MATVETALAPRFSAPEASATSWERTPRILQGAELSWISTVRSDGRPHVTPLVTVWADDALYVTCGPDEQKTRNLAANPAMVVTTGTDTWGAGVDVTEDRSTPS